MASQSGRPPPTSAKSSDLRAALGELPLFPLPQAALFPGARMPLHIFEPRYRQMTRDLLDGARCLAIAQIIDGPIDERGHPSIASVAGVGVVVEAHELPEGRYNVLLEGRARVRLHELPFVPPYRRARAELLEDLPGSVSPSDAASLLAVAHAFIAIVRARSPEFKLTFPPHLPAQKLADLAAHHLILDAAERQAALETLDPIARVRRVSDAIATQLATMRAQTDGPLN